MTCLATSMRWRKGHHFCTRPCVRSQNVNFAVKHQLEKNQAIFELLFSLVLCRRKKNVPVVRLVVDEIHEVMISAAI